MNFKKIALLLLNLFLNFTCVNQTSVNKNDEPNLIKQNIGPSGGTIMGPNGSSIEIPAGALSNNLEFSFESYISSEEFAKKIERTIFLISGGDFYPSGVVFSSPVTITLPCFSTFSYDTLACFYFDTVNKYWEYVGKAIPTEDKKSVKVAVSHFTTFGIFNFPADFLLEFERFLGDGSDPVGALDQFASWLETTTNIFNQRAVFNNCCYGVSGIFYDVIYKIGEIEKTIQKETGEKTPYVNTFSQREYYSHYQSADGKQIIFSILITLYLNCDQSIELTADKIEITKGESATISAKLLCGTSTMSNQKVVFSVTGPGSLNIDTVLTDANGIANVKVTSKDTGEIFVKAGYETCVCESCNRSVSHNITLYASDSTAQIQVWNIKVSVSSPGYKGEQRHKCVYHIEDYTGSYEFQIKTNNTNNLENIIIDSVICYFSIGSIHIDSCFFNYNSWISDIKVNSPKIGKVTFLPTSYDSLPWKFSIDTYNLLDTIIFFKVYVQLQVSPDITQWSSHFFAGIFKLPFYFKLTDEYTSNGPIQIFGPEEEGTYSLEVRRIK